MAIDFPGFVFSAESSGNLSAKQFYCLKWGSADGTVVLQDSSGAVCVGVLQNTPSTGGGDGAAVMVGGVTKVVQCSTSNAAITVGTALVSSTLGGILKKSTGSATEWILGRAGTSLSSGTTGIVSMQLTYEGYGSTSE